jgi:MscS family membrane protein
MAGIEDWIGELPDWMNNTWFQFIMMMLFWILVAIFVILAMRVVLRRLMAGTRTKADDALLRILDVPVLVLIIAYGIVESLSVLDVLPQWLWELIQTAYTFVLSVTAVYLVLKIYRGVVIPIMKDRFRKREKGLDKTLVPVIDNVGAMGIVLFGGLWILSYNGINITVFLAGAGIAGLVLAFALQDTLSNYFSGLYLMMDKPFKEGDIIIMNDDYCEVMAVGFRSTRLYNTFKHDLMIVPNNNLANQTIINKTEPDVHLRIDVSVGVAYGSPVDKVKEILRGSINAEPGVIKDDPDKEMSLRFRGFGDSALEFGVMFFIEHYDDQWRIASNIRERINQRFHEEGITVPFPQRTVSYLSEPNGARSVDGPGQASPAGV